MDRQCERLRIHTLRAQRRSYAVIAAFVAFLVALSLINDPKDTLTLAIALVFVFVTILILPDRWFCRDSADHRDDTPLTDGPRPALRSASPLPPSRPASPHHTRRWPPRHGPIPSPPPRPRRL